MNKGERRIIERKKRLVRVRERQLDRYVAKYAYWGARAASDYSREQFNAALVNVRYWSSMYALALADVAMFRIRFKRRSSNGAR